MTKIISIAEARKNFAQITDEVAFQGQEYLILKNGKEVAKLVPPTASTTVDPIISDWLEEFTTEFKEDLQTLADC